MNRKKELIIMMIVTTLTISAIIYIEQIRYRGEISYGLEIYHIEGNFSLGNTGLDNDSYSNITNITFVLEIHLSNPKSKIRIPLLYTNKTLTANKETWNQYHAPMKFRVNNTIQFHLVVNSSDPDIRNLKLFGENNFVNGSIVINEESMKYMPDMTYGDFSLTVKDSNRYVLEFGDNFTLTLREISVVGN